MDIQQLQEKNLMSSSLPPISQSNVSFINAHIENDGDHAFSSRNRFSKETGEYFNTQFDGQDPQDLALKFLTIINITNLIGDEFKEMYPNQAASTEVKLALKNGLEGFKSEGIDFILEHSIDFPITCVVFYDSKIYIEQVMQNLA